MHHTKDPAFGHCATYMLGRLGFVPEACDTEVAGVKLYAANVCSGMVWIPLYVLLHGASALAINAVVRLGDVRLFHNLNGSGRLMARTVLFDSFPEKSGDRMDMLRAEVDTFAAELQAAYAESETAHA